MNIYQVEYQWRENKMLCLREYYEGFFQVGKEILSV